MSAFDAIVIGSGAGGGAVAWSLTRAGLSVCVLEKGPHLRDADFFHDELAVCRRDLFVPSVFDEPNVVAREGGPLRPSSEGWIACCVGGGTVHMTGFFFRMREEDFVARSRFGAIDGADVADWPITLAELEPHYDAVERAIGVSGDAKSEGRATPYPLGPIVTHVAGALVDDACKKRGLHVFQCARAILSAPYDGRMACHYCGFCGSYGCETGAKSSSLDTFLALAEKTGKLTLIPRAMATRVVAKDGRARSVEYVDASGAAHSIDARVIVVAASAIQSARLLLTSGLAHGSGLLGRNLMVSTWSSGFARFAKTRATFPDDPPRLPFIDRAVQDLYVTRDGRKGGTILFTLPHPNPIYQATKLAKSRGEELLFGASLKRELRSFFRETGAIEFETFSEFHPHPGARVTLDPRVRDRFDLPVARVELPVHPESLAVSDLLAAEARAILDDAGAIDRGVADRERTYPVLQAGTARMGVDPSSSVIAPSGEAHDCRALYVADSSGFPSTPGAPWTLTIMANAARIAAGIVERGKKGEL